MLQKLLDHINTNFPFLKEKKLLIAISGGVDSVALTHLLSALNFNISLAHCNFNLRGKESDLDEAFVEKLGKEIKVPLFTTQFNTTQFSKENKQSTQIAARELRYNWFQKLAAQHAFDYILTAHHADDHLETFLINLTRGSGLDGLTGIPEINGNIVRPLLKFSRDDIMNFAKENQIDWREDKSNASTKYLRNKIRHQVLPILKEINPSLLATFAKITAHLKESQQIIEDCIEKVAPEILFVEGKTIKISIEKIAAFSNPKAYLYQFLKRYNFTEWKDVYNLLSAQSGKQVFSKTHVLLKDRAFLLLLQKDASPEVESVFFIEENQTEIVKPIQLQFEDIKEQVVQKATKNKQTIYLDKQHLVFPLKLRKWENGDFFYPTGMKGKKKVSKYFKDEKFSLLEKKQTWILCNNNNHILWIVGHRQDTRFVTTKQTLIPFSVKFLAH
jgi:tRNA(Ile)-lysidine synthase